MPARRILLVMTVLVLVASGSLALLGPTAVHIAAPAPYAAGPPAAIAFALIAWGAVLVLLARSWSDRTG